MNIESLMKRTNKKGISLGDAVPAIMIIATLFIVLIIVIYVLATLQVSVATTSTTRINESVAAVTATGALRYVQGSTNCSFSGFSITQIVNGTTTGKLVPSTNYSTTASGGINSSLAAASGVFNSSTWYVTYNYAGGGMACESASDLTDQTVNAVPIAGLVLIIVLVAIVVTVLLSSMILRKKGEGI